MAIRDVVTGGFGNGTFSGTIALVVTRGYSIGEPVVTVDGPGWAVAAMVYHPGPQKAEVYHPGPQKAEVVQQ